MKKALIIGASGLVGSSLLQLLLEDPRYEKIVSLVRKKSTFTHAKLEEHCCNFSKLQEHADYFEGIDELFICIGTTQKKTPDKKEYYAIDYGIPTESASIAISKHVKTIAVVSAMGANSQSRIFYNATKGKMEEYLKGLPVPHLIIVRPSLIVGPRKETRWGEQVATFLFKTFHFLIPKKYSAIQAKDIAQAMFVLSQRPPQKTTWENDELLELSNSKSQQ